MKRKELKGIVFVGILVIASILPNISFGFTPPTYTVMISDGGEPETSAVDIQSVWWTQDETYHYFKTVVSSGDLTGSYRGYFILIDVPGLGGGNLTGYAYGAAANPGVLEGIDYLIRAQPYTTGPGGRPLGLLDYYYFDGTTNAFLQYSSPPEWVGNASFQFNPSYSGPPQVEWRIEKPTSGFMSGSSFSFAGASRPAVYNGNLPNNYGMYDLTPMIPTPIPSAAYLLGTGIVGLVGLRRVRKRKN